MIDRVSFVSDSRLPCICAMLMGVFCLALSSTQAAEEIPLFQQQPYDRVVLNDASGGNEFDVLPLDLPGRNVPNPLPRGTLKVRLVENPGQAYELAWENVARVELFERRLIAKAAELTAAGQFDAAYDYLARLRSSYPDTQGLEVATNRYLQLNALQEFKKKNYDRALAILLTLYDRNPEFPALSKAVDTIGNRIVEGYASQGKRGAAREAMDVVEKQFPSLNLSFIRLWQRKFLAEADEQVAAARELRQQEQWRAARKQALEARAIWPNHRQAEALLKELQEAHPTLIVGVRVQAPRPARPRLDSVASMRLGMLTSPTLTRITDYSPEGGIYSSPVGAVGMDASGRELSLTILDYPAKSVAAFEAPGSVSRWLLEAADPSSFKYRSAIAEVVDKVVLPEPDLLIVELSRAHVRPEALLQGVPLDECDLAPPRGTYVAGSGGAGRVELEAIDQGLSVSALDELLYTDDNAALAAITRGDVDVLDRVAPWQLPALRKSRGVVVGRYRLPTVHVLVPMKSHPLLDEQGFRRAISYGIDRERTLKELILGGEELAGYQVVSGPFPAGISLSDPVRYGYNEVVKPRPYEPRLGGLLATVAWNKVQLEEHGKEDAADRPMPKLTLAHSSDPVARTACQAIQIQLKPMGIELELEELPEALLNDPKGDFHFRYAELATWEPVVDAKRLLGPEGLAGRCSDPMLAALDRLDEARNWNEVSAALRDIHELAAADLPIIPLWQTANYYARRSELAGLPNRTIHLYQSIADWRKKFGTRVR